MKRKSLKRTLALSTLMAAIAMLTLGCSALLDVDSLQEGGDKKDKGAEAGADGGLEAGTDAAGLEAGTDAAGLEAGTDAAGLEAGTDAAGLEAGTDAKPDVIGDMAPPDVLKDQAPPDVTPDQKVTPPDLTPDQTVVTPDQTVVTPDQTVVAPDQTVVTPDQTVVAPDQAVITSDMALVDQSVTTPDQSAAASCTDNMKNGAETDTDCGGGTCPKCGENQGCAIAGDCSSGVCNSGTSKCDPPNCTDGIKNGPESDVDCGGPCPSKCASGKGCGQHGDCTSDYCSSSNVCGTEPTHCTTGGVKDGDETDVDCGGSCKAKCADTKACAKGDDCQSKVCTSLVCAAPTCTDLAKNGTETDVDCGGSTCTTKCANGKFCATHTDCTSTYCNMGMMCDTEPAHCTTGGVKDGDESDVDCGGSCKTKCAAGKDCNTSNDCTSSTCTSGKCV